MIKLFFTLIFTSLFFHSYSQNHSTTLINSQGKVPDFLTRKNNYLFVSEDREWLYGTKSFDRRFFLDEIYKSGMVVFGDQTSEYCTNLLTQAGFKDIQVYLFRSITPATFSDPENKAIFITSGYISHCSYEAQLVFSLVREAEKINHPLSFSTLKTYGEKDINHFIQLLNKESDTAAIRLDQLVLNHLTAIGFNRYEIATAIDPYLYSEAPFIEVESNWEYFNKAPVYIPQDQWITYHSVERPYRPDTLYPLLNKRKILLNPEKIVQEHSVSQFSTEEKLNEQIKLCRLETINLNLLQTSFYMALYHVYTMESFGYTSEYLDLMKILAIWGISKDKNNEVNKIRNSMYAYSDNFGSVFIKNMKRFKAEIMLALNFRLIEDYTKKYGKTILTENIKNDLVRISKTISTFKIQNYSTKSIKALMDKIEELNNNQSSNNELSDKTHQYQQINLADSLKNFHYYMIPDLVSDSTFISLFTRDLKTANTTKSSDNIYVESLDIIPYKKGKISQKHLTRLSKSRINSDLVEFNIKIDTNNSTYSASAYNHKYAVNFTLMQEQNMSKNKNSRIINIKAIDFVGIDPVYYASYSHVYRPRIRSIQLLGVLVYPLVYVVPEYFVHGHFNELTVLRIDSADGMIDKTTRLNYFSPLSRLDLESTLLNVIKTY